MDAREQRSHRSALGRPAAKDDFLSRAALGFEPAIAAARGIGRIEFFRDDALEPDLAGRSQHCLGVRLQMRDIADSAALGLLSEEPLETRLALSERQGT